MEKIPDAPDPGRINMKSTRERLEEVRRQRERRGTSYQIGNSPSTLLINMAIQVMSTLILGVGIFYIIMYLNMRRQYMMSHHYNLFVGTMLLVAGVWLIYTVIRLRADILRYREAVRLRDERLNNRAPHK